MDFTDLVNKLETRYGKACIALYKDGPGYMACMSSGKEIRDDDYNTWSVHIDENGDEIADYDMLDKIYSCLFEEDEEMASKQADEIISYYKTPMWSYDSQK